MNTLQSTGSFLGDALILILYCWLMLALVGIATAVVHVLDRLGITAWFSRRWGNRR